MAQVMTPELPKVQRTPKAPGQWKYVYNPDKRRNVAVQIPERKQ